jgi:uncharacterized protein YqhQ
MLLSHVMGLMRMLVVDVIVDDIFQIFFVKTRIHALEGCHKLVILMSYWWHTYMFFFTKSINSQTVEVDSTNKTVKVAKNISCKLQLEKANSSSSSRNHDLNQ